MTGEEPRAVLVLDDHDDPEPYVMTGVGHYAVKHTYVDGDSGALVIVLDYHAMYRTIRSHILRRPPPKPDPGAP